ncbi:hypothetical protein QCA50_013936 [Cerrena zonata]|uniref:serine C-palmitoyltransferase n=1 Tax=Cerrena zonata TaxID=2478898 RepID=A0AAW0FPE0_9APHY
MIETDDEFEARKQSVPTFLRRYVRKLQPVESVIPSPVLEDEDSAKVQLGQFTDQQLRNEYVSILQGEDIAEIDESEDFLENAESELEIESDFSDIESIDLTQSVVNSARRPSPSSDNIQLAINELFTPQGLQEFIQSPLESSVLQKHLTYDGILTRSKYNKMVKPAEDVKDEAGKLLELIIEKRGEELKDILDGKELPKEHKKIEDDGDSIDDFADSKFDCVICQTNTREIITWPCRCFAICESFEPVNDLEKWELKSIPQVHGANGFEDIKSAAKGVISSAGVGACGPPNFYGTQDVHVRLEEDLSNFLGTEQAIIYGQDFVTAGSVIPAFLKRGDLIIADSGINLAIQKALIVSRCDIEWYDHNDMDHLEQILTEVKPVLDKQKPIRRRFIVTEGLFANSGEIANLPRIVELKNKFKYRLFLDETLSIGTIGKTGKGIVEHFNIPRSEISITIGSMALSFASSGGFCVGVAPMVHHQRIQSNAYVFSASLPPYSAKVTSEAIKLITSKTTSSVKALL